jgi:hypothetical protein
LKLPVAGASTARPVTVTNASGRPSRSTRASSPARTRSGTPAGTVAGEPAGGTASASREARRSVRSFSGLAVTGYHAVHPLGRFGRQRPGGHVGFHQAGIPGQRVAEAGGVRACPFPCRVGSHHEHRALAELVAEGKVRHIGLSEAWVDTIRRAHASTRSPRCSRSTPCGPATPSSM